MTTNPIYKTLPVKDIKDLSSKDFQRKLAQEAAEKEHNRRQRLETAKTDVIEKFIRWTPWVFLILLVCWAICVYYNLQEIKAGIENALAFIISTFLGSLLGKYVF